MIANWFSAATGDFPEHVMRDYEKVLELKYGENPHQRAATTPRSACASTCFRR